jgi:hypothetical protein
MNLSGDLMNLSGDLMNLPEICRVSGEIPRVSGEICRVSGEIQPVFASGLPALHQFQTPDNAPFAFRPGIENAFVFRKFLP